MLGDGLPVASRCPEWNRKWNRKWNWKWKWNRKQKAVTGWAVRRSDHAYAKVDGVPLSPIGSRRSPCRPGRSCEIGGQAWRCRASAWDGPVTERESKSCGAGRVTRRPRSESQKRKSQSQKLENENRKSESQIQKMKIEGHKPGIEHPPTIIEPQKIE